MRIKSLRLGNFKSIGECQTIDLAPITLLFGPNSAGKSTVLQSLVYLREILHEHNLDPDFTSLGGESMDLGGFRNLVHQHDLEKPMTLGVTLDLDGASLPSYLSGNEELLYEGKFLYRIADLLESVQEVEIVFSLLWSNERENPIVDSYMVRANGRTLIILKADPTKYDSAYITYINFSHKLLRQRSGDYEVSVDSSISSQFDQIFDQRELDVAFEEKRKGNIKNDLEEKSLQELGDDAMDCKDDISQMIRIEKAILLKFDQMCEEFVYLENELKLNDSILIGSDVIDSDIQHLESQLKKLEGEAKKLKSKQKELTAKNVAVQLTAGKLRDLEEERKTKMAAIYESERILKPKKEKLEVELEMARELLDGISESFSFAPLAEMDYQESSIPVIGDFSIGAIPIVSGQLKLGIKAQGVDIETEGPIVHMLSSITVGPIDLLKKQLEDLLYIGPLRAIPARVASPRLTKAPSRWARGLAAWEYLYAASEKEIIEINEWLGDKKLDTGYQIERVRYRELLSSSPLMQLMERSDSSDFDVEEFLKDMPEKTRVAMREEMGDLEVQLSDVGVGISQVLPIVVAALTHSKGMVIAEQPELHVHPAIQVELGDLFAAEALSKKNKTQFLLETHSEHLILRLLRRIRETTEGGVQDHLPFEDDVQHDFTLVKEDVSVIYADASKGSTRFRRLRITEDGEFLDKWPKGFFVERRKELF